MRKNDYRPKAASLRSRKRSPRQKRGSSFFFKLFLWLIVLGLVAGAWFAVSKTYQLLIHAQWTNWHAKEIAVEGISGQLNKDLAGLSAQYRGKAFSLKDSAALRADIVRKYPMLKDVSVSRGILSGKLTVSAKHRVPVAKFVLPDESVKYIDGDSTVYSDPAPNVLNPVPFVELEGTVPDKLSPEFIDLVESTLKLKKELDYAFLRMNLKENTVKMYMPDGSLIDFGEAKNLKKKAARAAQIMSFSRDRYVHPLQLDFEFFEYGKVFLRQKFH